MGGNGGGGRQCDRLDCTLSAYHYRAVMLLQASFSSMKHFGMLHACDFYVPICYPERHLLDMYVFTTDAISQRNLCAL